MRPIATFVGNDLINLSKELTSRSGISKFVVDGFLLFTEVLLFSGIVSNILHISNVLSVTAVHVKMKLEDNERLSLVNMKFSTKHK